MAPGLVDDPAEPTLTGQRLGVYQILDLLGVGGMGEVYRARDTRLGRDVAVKVLPRLFSADPERLARFEREARLLASLNHPHIAAIYGFEETAGVHALVLELVEGPTLAERLQRGPLPIAEAVRIARQIADALEAAHERGVVHRDLKPQNIKVKPDGTVKVLDFGLAKATMAAAHDADVSPTVNGAHRWNAGRHHSRHDQLHEPGAIPRTRGRQTNRYLGLRLRVVRDADGARAHSRARRSPTHWRRC